MEKSLLVNNEHHHNVFEKMDFLSISLTLLLWYYGTFFPDLIADYYTNKRPLGYPEQLQAQ